MARPRPTTLLLVLALHRARAVTTGQYGICPRGHACPAGSGTPLPCPAGKMSYALGLTSLSQCKDCTAGFVCPESGTVNATEPCAPGFWCPGGDASSNRSCTLGHYCAGGDRAPEPCAAGSFQNTTGAASCHACTPGSYCEQAAIYPSDCPEGFYCPKETTYATEFACPNGTYSNRTMLRSVDGCEPCFGGHYCETDGLGWPTGECADGYYCGLGANVATPDEKQLATSIYQGETCADQSTEDDANGVCPRGHYCPEGSTSPTACPPGTQNGALGRFNLSHCEPCEASFYCPDSGTIDATIPCEPGFYCPGGDVQPTLLCTEGHYCAGGDADPEPCAPGTFANVTGASECAACPISHYCELATVTPQWCPKGFYCPLHTQYGSQHPCPNGTFTNRTRLAHEADCEPCSPGHYCGAPGLPEPQGPCEAGFYCALGSATATPGDGEFERYLGETCNVMRPSETNGVCPVGHYCEEGSIAPTQCPPGTESKARGLHNVTECRPCTAGYVCPESGTINATIPCPANFSCPGGDIVATVTCPEGHYCAGGDAAPAPCEPGTYQNATAQDSGYACPAKTEYATAFPCPDGSFGNETMLNGTDQCEACTPGLYCNETGLTAPVGPCAAGYYCASGSNTSTPGDGEHWTYVGETCNSLQPGELSGVCPVGHYCEEGSIAPTQCPPGTESTARGLRNVSECPPCSAGFTCPNASTVVASKPCAPRFYCPGGDVVPTLLCSPGHFCDGGDPAPAPCLAGTYQDAEGQTDCKLCPAGYFCENATVTPADCPLGSYCPNGTRYGAQFLCPAGTYANRSLDQRLKTSGYYCASGSTTATPGDGDDDTYVGETCADQSDAELSGVCPVGHYCEEGSIAPTQCPPGTASNARGLHAESECAACPGGFICPESGMVSTNQTCAVGFYCPGGDVISTLICPRGHQCEAGTAEPVPCPLGTYNNATGATTCADCPRGRLLPRWGRVYCLVPPGLLLPAADGLGRR
ncbi:hypothetical protein JL722_1554 [Aureococcus anophagefferens]|nr:hypothetical protein JL722_1554 [Aureococcus anophagefferens]